MSKSRFSADDVLKTNQPSLKISQPISVGTRKKHLVLRDNENSSTHTDSKYGSNQ